MSQDHERQDPAHATSELLARFRRIENQFHELLDVCLAARPALSRARISELALFLEDEAWRGVDALEQLQALPYSHVQAAVAQCLRRDEPTADTGSWLAPQRRTLPAQRPGTRLASHPGLPPQIVQAPAARWGRG